MNALRIGSLCTGYGGLDMAVQAVFGGTLAWVADPDPGAAAILAHHHPDVPNLGDITVVDWADVEPVDILAAGFPCQDISYAGKRAGIRPGTRSGLWSEVFRAIVELHPELVVLENVSALLSGDWDVEPNDRCVCGWPRRRRGLYRNRLQEGQRELHDPRGHRNDRQSQAGPRNDQTGVRRAHREVPRADGPMGGRLRVEHPREGGSRLPRANRTVPAAQVRAGRDRVEGRGDPTVAGDYAHGTSALDGRGQNTLRDAQRTNARAEPQGSGMPSGPKEWDTLCPACGRSLGDGAVRPVFRSGLGRVLRDLASIGFDAEWTCVRASDVGASHQRWRWFLLARAADADRAGLEGAGLRRAAAERGLAASDATDHGHERGGIARRWRSGSPDRHLPTPHTSGDGRHEGRPEPARQLRRPDAALGRAPALANAAGQRHGHTGPASLRRVPAAVVASDPGIEWGDYAPAIGRWEHVTGRPVPRPTEPGRTGDRLSPAFVEWLMGLPAGHVTDVPGLSRNAQLKALGNGVVPQQGAAALALLLDRMEAAA